MIDYNEPKVEFNKKFLIEKSNELWDKSKCEYEKKSEEINKHYKDVLEYRYLHCKIVAELSDMMFCNYYNNFFESDISKRKAIYFTALVHDIKKLDKSHSKVAKNF